MLLVGTVFSGIGAPEQALKNINIPHIVKWACDIDKKCKESYFLNHNCGQWLDDITKIDLDNLPYVDLFVFGFPCQDVSIAGKQNLEGGRTELVKYSLNIIDKILPKYILFENVKGLLSNKFTPFFEYIKDRIEKNYNFRLLELNSKDFCVGQNRERIFGIGVRKDLNINPDFFFFKKNINFAELLEDNVDNKYFLPEEKVSKILDLCKNKQKNFRLENKFGELKQANKNGFFGDKKIRYSGTMWCQNCIDIHGIIYPDGKTMRRLTPRECARMHGFPDNFILNSKDSIAYRQLGNTITVPILEYIFSILLVNTLDN